MPDADGSNRPVRIASGQSGEVVWKIPAVVVYLVDVLLLFFRRAKKIRAAPLSSEFHR